MLINKIFIIFLILQFFISSNAGCKYQYVEKNGECEHKSLFHSFSFYDGLGLALIFIFSTFASIGGSAGGVVFVPIYLLILNFDAHDSISSSICMMGVTQIIIMIIACKMRHPFKNRPIIDYSFAAMIAPSAFLGNIFGVLFNMLLANLIIKILFLFLIAYTFWKQTKKGIQVWKKEQQDKLKLKQAIETSLLKEESLAMIENNTNLDVEIQTNFSYLYQKYKTQNQNQISNNNINTEIQDDTEFVIEDLQPEVIPENIQKLYDKYCHRETQYVYWNRLIPISIAFFLVSFVTYLKGSARLNSIVGVQVCSSWFWVLTFITIPFIFQSFLGIGGGIILAPVLLSYKIPADVVTFTSQFLALLGAINNLIQYLIMGHIVWNYVGIASLLAGTSVIIGLKLVIKDFINNIIQVMPYFQKKKKRSLIIFSLSLIEFGSFIIVLINSILHAQQDSNEGKSLWAMKSFCH